MIHVQGISHYYEQEQVLYDVNIKIDDGEFIALTGESGSGKSTLLSILSTLLKPSSGHVSYDEVGYAEIQDIDTFRRQHIGFVFQFHYLIEYLSVQENITLAQEKQDDAYVEELLEVLKITPLRDKLPNQLSGGQRQRVAIARALINRPTFIFADEPTGNLDSVNSQNVFELFKEISQQGTTVIVATHDIKRAAMADKTYELHDGKL